MAQLFCDAWNWARIYWLERNDFGKNIVYEERIMTSNLVTFRMQMLILMLSTGIFSLQLEPFLTSRGITTQTIIIIYSIVQFLSIFFTLFWGKIIHSSDKGYLIIRFGVMARAIVIGLMCFHVDNAFLIVLVFLYFFLAGGLNVANEAQLLRWCSEEKQDFGRVRLFGSVGFAISGLVATVVIALTGTIDSIIFFAFLINIFFVFLSLYRPLKPGAVKKKAKEDSFKLNAKTLLLLVLVIIPLTLPLCFNLIMNFHFREGMDSSMNAAIFFSGLALFFSAGLSETTAFVYVERILAKIGPNKLIFIGLLASVLRWEIASVAHTPLLFSCTYLLHGICFTFTYMGALSIIKKKFGDDSIGKTMTVFSVVFAGLSVVLSQMFIYFLNYSDTFAILQLFTVTSIVCCIVYYFVFWRDKRYFSVL